MIYADATYYNDIYNGVSVGDDLDRLLQRASSKIDALTKYKIKDFNNLSDSLQTAIKNATCAQVESWQMAGGYESSLNSDVQSVNVGAFSYNKDSNNNKINKSEQVVLNFLYPTGFLYDGVDTIGY